MATIGVSASGIQCFCCSLFEGQIGGVWLKIDRRTAPAFTSSWNIIYYQSLSCLSACCVISSSACACDRIWALAEMAGRRSLYFLLIRSQKDLSTKKTHLTQAPLHCFCFFMCVFMDQAMKVSTRACRASWSQTWWGNYSVVNRETAV